MLTLDRLKPSTFLRIAHFFVPLLATSFHVGYFWLMYTLLYFSRAEWRWWQTLLFIPPLFIEVFATHFHEAAGKRWSIVTVIGFVGRFMAIMFMHGWFIVIPMVLKDTPDLMFPLVGYWPYVVLFVMALSPFRFSMLVIITGLLHYFLVYRRRFFRGVVHLVIPTLTIGTLFYLFYFNSYKEHYLHGMRPDFVEKVYPSEDRLYDKEEEFFMFFPREIYVTPDEKTAILSGGPTFMRLFSGGRKPRPGFFWLDIEEKEMSPILSNSRGRHFTTTCDERVFVPYWNEPAIIELDPINRTSEVHDIAVDVPGYPLPEWPDWHHSNPDLRPYYSNTYLTHFCEFNLVIVAHTPATFLGYWDTKDERFIETIILADHPDIRWGDSNRIIEPIPGTQKALIHLLGLGDIIVYDVLDRKVEKILDTPRMTYDIRVAPEQDFFVATAFYNRYAYKINLDTFDIEGKLPIPIHARRIAFSPDGKLMFGAGYFSGQVWVVNTDTGELLEKIPVAPRLEGMHVAGNNVYCLSPQGVYRFSYERYENDPQLPHSNVR